MNKEMRSVLKKELSTILIKTRDSFGLTQEKMAESLFIDVRSYQNLESERSLPRFETFTALLAAFPDTDLSRMFKVLTERLEITPYRKKDSQDGGQDYPTTK